MRVLNEKNIQNGSKLYSTQPLPFNPVLMKQINYIEPVKLFTRNILDSKIYLQIIVMILKNALFNIKCTYL